MVKIGDKIKILNMKDDTHYNGGEGVVEYIDAQKQLHGTWGSLAIIPEIDKFAVLERKQDET